MQGSASNKFLQLLLVDLFLATIVGAVLHADSAYIYKGETRFLFDGEYFFMPENSVLEVKYPPINQELHASDPYIPNQMVDYSNLVFDEECEVERCSRPYSSSLEVDSEGYQTVKYFFKWPIQNQNSYFLLSFAGCNMPEEEGSYSFEYKWYGSEGTVYFQDLAEFHVISTPTKFGPSSKVYWNSHELTFHLELAHWENVENNFHFFLMSFFELNYFHKWKFSCDSYDHCNPAALMSIDSNKVTIAGLIRENPQNPQKKVIFRINVDEDKTYDLVENPVYVYIADSHYGALSFTYLVSEEPEYTLYCSGYYQSFDCSMDMGDMPLEEVYFDFPSTVNASNVTINVRAGDALIKGRQNENGSFVFGKLPIEEVQKKIIVSDLIVDVERLLEDNSQTLTLKIVQEEGEREVSARIRFAEETASRF